MEKKRWGLIFSGLCLALVFSVSSVEAANQCAPCERCDRDGDSYINDSQPCRNKCGDTKLDPDDTNPEDPGDGTVVGCSVGVDVNISLYEVTLTGDVTSDKTFWKGSASDGKTISIEFRNPGGTTLNLSVLVASDDELKVKCFPEAGTTLLFAASLQSKNVKGPVDQAIGMFWFDGKNDNETIDVAYLLQMFGTFSSDDGWPGTNEVTFTEWEMKVESTTRGGRKSACTSTSTSTSEVLFETKAIVTLFEETPD